MGRGAGVGRGRGTGVIRLGFAVGAGVGVGVALAPRLICGLVSSSIAAVTIPAKRDRGFISREFSGLGLQDIFRNFR